MQTTAELIAEVQEQTGDIEGTDFWIESFLAVWFETTRSAVPISGCNPNSLEELNSMVEQGGRAIGVVHIESKAEGLEVWSRPTADYKDQNWVADVLNTLVDRIANDLDAESRANPPHS